MKKFLVFFGVFLAVSPILHTALPVKKEGEAEKPTGEYVVKDFSHLLGMEGFNDELLQMHFTLYQGYVQNANGLIALLKTYIRASGPRDYSYQALKRRFAWEFDGMRLHEYYFANLGGKTPLDNSSELYQMLVKDFGSYENWKQDFIATGMIRGIGWSVLYFDKEAGRLFNTWVNEHDLGHLAGGDIILVMDVFEHAYMPQFGLNRAKYIEAFFKNIAWEVALSRFQKAAVNFNVKVS